MTLPVPQLDHMGLTASHLAPFDSGFDVAAFLATTPRRVFADSWGPIIERYCAEANLNQRLILAKLQHEQSLLRCSDAQAKARQARCLGYGCLAGGDLPGMSGFANQVSRACRRYRYWLDGKDEDGALWAAFQRLGLGATEENRPRAIFEAYTPEHGRGNEGNKGSLKLFLQVWHMMFGNVVNEAEEETMTTNADVARVARQAAKARQAGRSLLTIGKVLFNLVETGGCWRFIRECHEAALGLAEYHWQWQAPSAAVAEYKLKAAGKRVDDPQPGDIIALNGTVPAGKLNDLKWQKANNCFGHIAIFLGNGLVAENTSRRYEDGPHEGEKMRTVISPLADVVKHRTGYYRVLPPAEAAGLSLTIWGRSCRVRLLDGTGPHGEDEAWCPVRASAELRGETVDTSAYPAIKVTQEDGG